MKETTKYDSFLKNHLNFDDFDYKETIEEEEGGGVMKTIKMLNNKNKMLYMVKVLSISKENSEQVTKIKEEIDLYEKISKNISKPTSLPKYCGYVVEKPSNNEYIYNIFFRFYDQNLKGFIEKAANKINLVIISKLFYSIIRGLAFLETYNIANIAITTTNIMVDEKKQRILLTNYITNHTKSKVISMRSLILIIFEIAGIKQFDEISPFSTQEYNEMLHNFYVKYNHEINANKEFLETLKTLTIYNTEMNFREMFIKSLEFVNKDRSKYHIYVQEKTYRQIKQLYKEDYEKILIDIYKTLDNFFISPENSSENSIFKEKVIKNYHLIKKLACINEPISLLIKGIIYEYGIKKKKNIEKAAEYYRKAINISEDSFASYRLGIYLQRDKKDFKAGVLEFEKSASKGNSYGINSMGVCYNQGEGVEKNYKKAIELYEKAASLGNSRGIFILITYISIQYYFSSKKYSTLL